MLCAANSGFSCFSIFNTVSSLFVAAAVIYTDRFKVGKLMTSVLSEHLLCLFSFVLQTHTPKIQFLTARVKKCTLL
jgi:hypothetical protein